MTSPISLLRLTVPLVLGLASACAARADDESAWGPWRYEVKIANLTRGQQFTPILATNHRASVSLFQLGPPASRELAILAEEGNPAPLAAMLLANPAVGTVVTGSGLTNPGATTTLVLQGRAALPDLASQPC